MRQIKNCQTIYLHDNELVMMRTCVADAFCPVFKAKVPHVKCFMCLFSVLH